MNRTPKQYSYSKGFTLVESIVYFSLLVILSIVVINSLFSLFGSYSKIKAMQDMETTAIQVLDRITRDARASNTIIDAQSSFSVPQGYVSLYMLAPGGGSMDTVKYYASSSAIKIDKNGTYLGDLSLSSVKVNSFLLRYINGTSTRALKIELGLQTSVRHSSSTIYKNFYTTVQLR